MTKKKVRGLGTNPLATHPLDAIIPKEAATPPPPPTARRERFSSYVSTAAADTLRDIAWWSRVPLAALVESAFRREIEAREKENGGPFQPRQSELPKGSRV
jgi:hypothetical protein